LILLVILTVPSSNTSPVTLHARSPSARMQVCHAEELHSCMGLFGTFNMSFWLSVFLRNVKHVLPRRIQIFIISFCQALNLISRTLPLFCILYVCSFFFWGGGAELFVTLLPYHIVYRTAL